MRTGYSTVPPVSLLSGGGVMPPWDVGEDVLVDVAVEPEVLDVGVAEVAVDADVVIGRGAALVVEGGADAAVLPGVATPPSARR